PGPPAPRAAVTFAATVREPPLVVVRLRVFPDPASAAAVTVRPLALASVIETLPTPVLVKPARVSNRFVPCRPRPPAGEPFGGPAVMTPDVWFSAPAETKSIVPPAAVRLAAR